MHRRSSCPQKGIALPCHTPVSQLLSHQSQFSVALTDRSTLIIGPFLSQTPFQDPVARSSHICLSWFFLKDKATQFVQAQGFSRLTCFGGEKKNNKQKTHKHFSDRPCGTIVPGTNPHPSQGHMGQNGDLTVELNRKRPVCPRDRSQFVPGKGPVCAMTVRVCPGHRPAQNVYVYWFSSCRIVSGSENNKRPGSRGFKKLSEFGNSCLHGYESSQITCFTLFQCNQRGEDDP